ncbi:MAG: hypothetical protein FWC13_01460 [Oscillospiraceae bacterium]|nr:hypothetical protein [Oscillospiraceae bacterium]
MERTIKAYETGNVINNSGMKERINIMINSIKEKTVALARRIRRKKSADDIYYIYESQRHADMARAEHARYGQFGMFR